MYCAKIDITNDETTPTFENLQDLVDFLESEYFDDSRTFQIYKLEKYGEVECVVNQDMVFRKEDSCKKVKKK